MIIDFECDSPTAEVKKETIALLRSGSGYTHRGYFSTFGKTWAGLFGMSLKEFEEETKKIGRIEMAVRVAEHYFDPLMTNEGFIQMMDDAGVTHACIGTTGQWSSVEDRALLANKYKDRFSAFYRSDPNMGMDDVLEFERTVKELNFKGMVVSGFRANLPSNHKKYYPFYGKCVELGVPARITTGLHLYTDRPIDLCRPDQLDEIACDFPDLVIVAGLGGWPWVPELLAVAKRHRNVFVDTSCQRPKHMAATGSGFESLIAEGNRGLQDQIIFASGWATQGLSLKQIIGETEDLCRSETIRKKWMYENAARVLGID